MMKGNVLGIKKIDEIKLEADISPDMVLSPNKEFVTIETLRAKFLKLQDKLTKMGEAIKDLEEILYNHN